MTTNKSQYTLTTQWIVPEDKKSEVESFFAEDEVWMRETHNLSGNDEPRIVDYSVSKAPQYIENDLEKGPSGKTIYSLHEVYVTDQGAMKHFELWRHILQLKRWQVWLNIKLKCHLMQKLLHQWNHKEGE